MGIDLSENSDKSTFNFFTVGSNKVRVSADSPHLLKNLRNAFQKFDFVLSDEIVKYYKLPSNTVKMQHIRDLYQFDCQAELKYAPNLKDDCFDVHGLAAMNVPKAKRLLSQEVGAGLEALVEIHKYPIEYKTTAFFCNMIGRWYNLVTSRRRDFAISKKDVRRFEDEMNFLDEVVHLINSTQFSAKQRSKNFVQKGFTLSIASLKDVVIYLLETKDYEYVLCGRFTGDCIENLFSVVRKRDKAPTPLQFTNILETLTFLGQLRPSKYGAYEEDEQSCWVTEISDFIKMYDESDEIAEKDDKELDLFVCEYEHKDHAEQRVLMNLIGYLLSKTICSISFCKDCKEVFTSKEPCLPEHEFIEMKEYKKYALVYPSQLAFKIFNMAEDTFRYHREKLHDGENVQEQIIDKLDEVIRDKFVIPFCHLDLLLKRWFKIRMYFWASELNKQMKKAHSKEIVGLANASASMAGYYLNK